MHIEDQTRIIRKFDFHAAHQLLSFPEGHKCRQMHGHTFSCEVVLEGQVDSGEDTLVQNSWLRLPPGSRLQLLAGKEGARCWTKTGHLGLVDAQIRRLQSV